MDTRKASILEWFRRELNKFKDEALEADDVKTFSVVLRFKQGSKIPDTKSVQLESSSGERTAAQQRISGPLK